MTSRGSEPGAAGGQPELPGFRVALSNFEGPFDLLLSLISSRKMDLTEVALSAVTDEFVAYTRTLDAADDLEQMTQFLVVAATLLDLKAARLLPRGAVEDQADIDALESRDLLFARLLQYRAYRAVAEILAQWQMQAQPRYPRAVGMEEHFAALLPPVRIDMTPEKFAELAAVTFRSRPAEHVSTDHVHAPEVSVPEQAERIMQTLRAAGCHTWLSFSTLTADCPASVLVIGRFLALLELYKAKAVDTRQEEPLGPLDVAWTGLDVDPAVVTAANWDER